jgi:hypothetical protein
MNPNPLEAQFETPAHRPAMTKLVCVCGVLQSDLDEGELIAYTHLVAWRNAKAEEVASNYALPRRETASM